MSEPENDAKNFKTQLEVMVATMKASLEKDKLESRKDLEKLRQAGTELGVFRVIDSIMFDGILYISQSRTADDIATLDIVAKLAQYVCDLTDSVKMLRNMVNPELRSKVDALVPYLPPLTDLTNAINRKLQQMREEEETKRGFINKLAKQFDKKKPD